MEMARGAAQIYQGFYKSQQADIRAITLPLATGFGFFLPWRISALVSNDTITRSPNYQILDRAIRLHHKWNKILEYLK